MSNFKFSKESLEKLETVDVDLQSVVTLALTITKIDFAVICGHRDRQGQEEANRMGTSRLIFPNSKHNRYPSEAVDLAPYVKGNIPWENKNSFRIVSEAMFKAAKTLNVKIAWGGNWKFYDGPHYELLK